MKGLTLQVEIDPLLDPKWMRHRICKIAVIGKYGSLHRFAEHLHIQRSILSEVILGSYYDPRVAQELADLTGISLSSLFPGRTGEEFKRRRKRRKGLHMGIPGKEHLPARRRRTLKKA